MFSEATSEGTWLFRLSWVLPDGWRSPRTPALLCSPLQDARLLGCLVFLGASWSGAPSQGPRHHSPAHRNPLHAVPHSPQLFFLLAKLEFTNCTNHPGISVNKQRTRRHSFCHFTYSADSMLITDQMTSHKNSRVCRCVLEGFLLSLLTSWWRLSAKAELWITPSRKGRVAEEWTAESAVRAVTQ